MAAITTGCAPYYAGLLILALLQLTTGLDIYSNSYISPNSDTDEISPVSLEASLTSGPTEIGTESKTRSGEISSSARERLARSAEPIIAPTYGKNDDLTYYKNMVENIESNDVELSGRVAKFIQPSRTLKEGEISSLLQTSGEVWGAPQERELLEPHTLLPTVSTMNSVTQSPLQGKPRQANPDIQDIITGIVKLLNGNVNVQANTAPALGRPIRPISTRINNRGPPRISDLPALPPDFDIPSPPLLPISQQNQKPPMSTRMPTPYPFDVPPQNTSPARPYGNPSQMHQNKRPGFYKPVTIPPWSRPPLRRPLIHPMRRPNPMPPYKPQDTISITSDKPMQDILTLDLGAGMTYSEENMNTQESVDGQQHLDNQENFNVQQHLDNQEHVENKDDQENVTTQAPEITTPKEVPTVPEEIDPTEVSTDIIPTTSVNVSIDLNSSSPIIVANEATPILEASIQDAISTIKEDLLSPTSIINSPTEALPNIMPSSAASIEVSPKIESTSVLITNKTNATEAPSGEGFQYHPYKPRPGIVLDDTEYKPGLAKRPPIITSRPPLGQLGEIFDITVSAIQGPGSSSAGAGRPYVIPVEVDGVHLGNGVDVITSANGDEGFVSIDGKRTYLNLFGEPTANPPSTSKIAPSATGTVVKATGYAVPDFEKGKPDIGNNLKPTPRRPLYGKRPTQPPVRIDTCIVGDDSTCDASQFEVCRTETGVSSCHCRPGFARRKHREPCRKVVSVVLSLRVDRLYERRIVWTGELGNKASESYQQLSFEAERALASAMSMTPFSDEFLSAKVNTVFKGERSAGQAGVFVNLTLQLEENAETSRPNIKGDIQRHLLGVIQRRSNNIGNSALWVDSPPGSVSSLQDVDECTSPELHDCHVLAKCVNTFGGFKCECNRGYRDPWSDNRHRAGRHCEQCSPQHCNNRGECRYEGGQEVCVCSGNYYGNQCELDGEVLGVAIGASVAAVIIIGLTLVCLVMWSRRWNREQKAAIGSPVFGYMATASNSVKTPVVGAPPYQMTLEDRLRWAQIADAMVQTNHYAPEPVTNTTRPSSAMFGYPSLSIAGTLPHSHLHGTLPPIPLPRLNISASLAGRAASVHGMRPLDNSSSSEEEDKVDLLGRSFQVPRPKSRSNASIANQSGIYYDVDYDQHDIYKHPSGNIPMSTYTAGRHPFYRS